MYRQIFKKSFFYSFQSNQTRYFTAYLDSSRAEKKKKKKKKSIWELNASATDTRMWQSKISNKPDQPRSHGLFLTWGWGAPPPGKGKAMGTRLERKNSSARAFLTLYISHLVVFRKTTTWNHQESGRSTGGARPGAYHVRINRFFQNQQTSRTRWCLPFAIVLGWWDWKLENLANGKEISADYLWS